MAPDHQPKNASVGLKMEDLRLAVISDAAPERNGVGAYYEDLVGYLAPRVAAIEVFSPTIEDGVWQAGLVFPMPGDTTQKICFPNVWALHRDLERLEPHVVIIPTPGVYGWAGAWLAARRHRPVLTGFHTSFEQIARLYWQGTLTEKVFRQYFDRIHRYLFGVSHAVFANSAEMEQLAISMGAKDVRLVGTPIPRLFAAQPRVTYEGGFERILFAGRLAAEKNIEAIIAAAENLPGLRFSLAGDGPFRQLVEQAASRLPNLEYLGWKYREELCREIDAHDALILPSHFESFGTIALEAMSRGRVVLVSEHAGITAWQELKEGLDVIGKEGLTGALRRVSEMTVTARVGLAEQAYQLAQQFNNHNLEGWENLLLDTAR